MTKKEYKYECEYCRKAPKNGQWPRNYRWKTERGFNNHNCYKAEQEQQQKKREKQEIQLQERRENSTYKIGQTVLYWNYNVTKPIYEVNTWGRKVKKRYEEERSYFAAEGEITEILLDGYVIDKWIRIPEGNVCKSLKEALTEAGERGKAYKEQCEFAQKCR